MHTANKGKSSAVNRRQKASKSVPLPLEIPSSFEHNRILVASGNIPSEGPNILRSPNNMLLETGPKSLARVNGPVLVLVVVGSFGFKQIRVLLHAFLPLFLLLFHVLRLFSWLLITVGKTSHRYSGERPDASLMNKRFLEFDVVHI